MKASLLAVILLVVTPLSAHAMSDNSLGLFLGYRNVGSHSGFATGLEFEHKLMPMIGAAAFIEKTFSSPSSTALGAALVFHPVPYLGLKVLGGAGVDIAGGEKHLLLRAGGAYELDFGPVFTGPAIYLDSVGDYFGYVLGWVVGAGF